MPIEFEFGVPIPGEILPQDRWTKTAIKKLPSPGPLDFTAIFGRSAPIVLDIGCGNGRFTLASALARPRFDHLATDILPVVIRYATRRGNQRGLSNARFAVIGGGELLRDYIAPHSISEIHVYHPQPYYERRQYRFRLIAPEFLALSHRALVPGGLFVLQTDNPAYWRYMQHVVPKFFEFTEHPGPWPDAPHGRTRREILAMQAGLPIFRGTGRPRPELGDADLQRLIAELPLPRFNADRGAAKLDRLERE
jgi:tRNA (guanine-N7-)-methyltransferase